MSNPDQNGDPAAAAASSGTAGYQPGFSGQASSLPGSVYNGNPWNSLLGSPAAGPQSGGATLPPMMSGGPSGPGL